MMTSELPAVELRGLDRLRDLLRLISELRAVGDITTPDGLRRAIELVLNFAVLLGLEESFVERLRRILEDERVFELALAIVRYLAGLVEFNGVTSEGRLQLAAVGEAPIEVETRGFIEWLPLILQVIELIRRLRESL